MSGRLANAAHTNRRAALVASAVAFVVMCGIAVAQPSKPPTKEPTADPLDPNPPVPNDAPRRAPHEKFKLDTKAPIFNRVEDFKAPTEAENPDEYQAWVSVVMQTRPFASADLESHAARDLIPFDLLKPHRSLFRYELLRFDGKLVCVRRLEAPLFFRNNPESTIKELYEARLIPVDESPLNPVSIVFFDLPEALAEVAGKPFGVWADKDAWVTAAGFYFKTLNVPGAQANQVVGVPVLVGKSVTVHKAAATAGPPSIAGVNDTDPTALDRDVRVYKFIRDERPMIRYDTPPEEIASFTRVMIHSARFPAEQLEEHAQFVKFADLFTEVRRDYKLKNVKFEGRLIRLKRMDVNPELRAAGVNQAFEGWVVPANEPRGNPICVAFTEPLPGVEPANPANPTGNVNKWVSFAGFSFKKILYESGEPDPKNPGKNLFKYAPLLVGKGPIARDDRDPDRPTALTWGGFVLGVIIAGVVLIGAAGALTWYYRRGDRAAKAEMDAVRSRNPFDAATQPTSAPTALPETTGATGPMDPATGPPPA